MERGRKKGKRGREVFSSYLHGSVREERAIEGGVRMEREGKRGEGGRHGGR